MKLCVKNSLLFKKSKGEKENKDKIRDKIF